MTNAFNAALLGFIPSRPKLLQKSSLQRKCFGTINFVKITKQSLYKANSFACSLANKDKPVAATLQRQCSGGILFVMLTKIITKIIVSWNYFVIVSARMVKAVGLRVPAPPTKYKTPLKPKYTPKYAPNLSRNQNTEKLRKNCENPRFLCTFFVVFFSYFGFGRGFGVYVGVYFGAQRAFVFCRGARTRNCWHPRLRRTFFASRNPKSVLKCFLIIDSARRSLVKSQTELNCASSLLSDQPQECNTENRLLHRTAKNSYMSGAFTA